MAASPGRYRYRMEIVLLSIEQFKKDLTDILGENLYEILIHGSYVLGDFTPNRGDLDYTILTERNLSNSSIAKLYRLHDGYRTKKELVLHQLEGTIYPKHVLSCIASPFIGCYIGTRRSGWRKITTFQNSLFDLIIMREQGIHLFGRSVSFHQPTDDEIHAAQMMDLSNLRKSLQEPANNAIGAAVSSIHWCARTLYFGQKGVIASKGDACRSCKENSGLAIFRDLFKIAEKLRHPIKDTIQKDNLVPMCLKLLDHTELRLKLRE